MPKKTDLFIAALGNESYLSEINSSPKNSLQFIETLKENQFSYQDIIELINAVSNPKVRSLLIIRLLCQKEYLINLKGESLLDRLADTGIVAIPSRLNAWLYQIDVTVLTRELIQRMDPEATVSILCAVPHFHQLTEIQVYDLLHQYLKPELIVYWVKNFASMPNAYHVLAHLIKLIPNNVIEAIEDLEAIKKERIITNILEHLNLFYPIPKKLLAIANNESHLILAMKLYLNGHFYHAYTDFIGQLITHLLKIQHPFSLVSIQLLFSLNHVSELTDIINEASELTNNYLKTNAEEGNLSLLYRNGDIDIQRMSQTIKIKKDSFENTKSPNKANFLIKEIIGQKKAIICIEYFLIHYQGAIKPLNMMLSAYLKYYAQQKKSTFRDQALHSLSFFLLKDQLHFGIREALFTAFLDHPTLYDANIVHCLFLYNTTKTIQYFGLQGGEKNYEIVLRLCTLALKKLDFDKNKNIIQIIQKAQAEAKIELQFNKETNWFAVFLNYIKRFWVYGWGGFFRPKAPVYVTTQPIKTQLMQEHDYQEMLYAPQKDLPTLLEEMNATPLTQEKLELLMEGLERYSLKEMVKDEFETRLKLHNLFYQVLLNKEKNIFLYGWLMSQQGLLLRNQFRLLELSFKEKSAADVATLVTQISKGPDELKCILNELNCILPDQKKHKGTTPPKKTANPKTIPDATDTITEITWPLTQAISEATKTAQSAWKWAVNAKEVFFTQADDVSPKGTKFRQKASP